MHLEHRAWRSAPSTPARRRGPQRTLARYAGVCFGVGVLAAVAGCGEASPTTSAPPPPAPPPAPRTVLLSPTFGGHIVEIFQRRGCMATGCHGTGAGALTLADTATSYANLVDVVGACNGMIRVIPGDPDNSVLVQKVEGTQVCGARMPLGDVPLDSIDIANIRNWVTQDAFNN